MGEPFSNIPGIRPKLERAQGGSQPGIHPKGPMGPMGSPWTFWALGAHGLPLGPWSPISPYSTPLVLARLLLRFACILYVFNFNPCHRYNSRAQVQRIELRASVHTSGQRSKDSIHECQQIAYAFLAFIAFIAFLGAAAAAFAAFFILLAREKGVNLRECECHSRLASLNTKKQQNCFLRYTTMHTSI